MEFKKKEGEFGKNRGEVYEGIFTRLDLTYFCIYIVL
jgi:hypothetical protein